MRIISRRNILKNKRKTRTSDGNKSVDNNYKLLFHIIVSVQFSNISKSLTLIRIIAIRLYF